MLGWILILEQCIGKQVKYKHLASEVSCSLSLRRFEQQCQLKLYTAITVDKPHCISRKAMLDGLKKSKRVDETSSVSRAVRL